MNIEFDQLENDPFTTTTTTVGKVLIEGTH